MPNWKKVIISGSDASLPNIYLDDYIYHSGDLNTYFGFQGGDTIEKSIGSTNVIRYYPTYTVFNGSSNDVDFRVNTDNEQNTLYVEGSTNNVGIGTSTPTEKLQVKGNISSSGDLLLNQSILSYQTNTDINTGIETVATIDGSAYKAAFFDYVAVSASVNIRAGSIMVAHDGTNTTQAEASTQDLGNTAGIKFSSSIDGSNNFRLSAAVSSNNWSVKTVVRGI